MVARFRSRPRLRPLLGAAAVVGMWWVAFEGGERLPVVTYVNLGIHELGHLLTYSLPDLATALMGSIAQVAVPGALAAYFLLRGDWTAAGLCLAWGATSALEVAIYVADAPTQELVLIGGSHDWAYILGPEGYGALDRAAPLAEQIRAGAWVALAAGLGLCLASALGRGGGAANQEGAPTASASRVTPVSSPWAASATSGSAPRSASSPQ